MPVPRTREQIMALSTASLYWRHAWPHLLRKRMRDTRRRGRLAAVGPRQEGEHGRGAIAVATHARVEMLAHRFNQPRADLLGRHDGRERVAETAYRVEKRVAAAKPRLAVQLQHGLAQPPLRPAHA